MATGFGDLIRIVDKGLLYGSKMYNVYHSIVSGYGTVSDVGIMTAVKNWLNFIHTEMIDQISEDYYFETFSVYNVDDDYLVGEDPFTTTTQGVSETAPLPNQMAPVIRFPTQTKGSQGRKFIGGFTEGTTDGGGICDVAALAALTDAALVMLAGWADGTVVGNMCNHNYLLDSNRPWLSAIVNSVMGTQRRRKTGVGI